MTLEQVGLSLAGQCPSWAGRSGVSKVLVAGSIGSRRQVMNQVQGSPRDFRQDKKQMIPEMGLETRFQVESEVH